MNLKGPLMMETGLIYFEGATAKRRNSQLSVSQWCNFSQSCSFHIIDPKLNSFTRSLTDIQEHSAELMGITVSGSFIHILSPLRIVSFSINILISHMTNQPQKPFTNQTVDNANRSSFDMEDFLH